MTATSVILVNIMRATGKGFLTRYSTGASGRLWLLGQRRSRIHDRYGDIRMAITLRDPGLRLIYWHMRYGGGPGSPDF